MLTSIAIILLLGMAMGRVFAKLKLPSLLGMILVGVVAGPYALNLIDGTLLEISDEIRQVALVIILTRAGLELDIKDLKKVGRPAILMCFVPACFEILGAMLLAPPLLGVSMLDGAIIGSVLAAVSPAVIVPRMIKLMDEGYGTEKGIPQLLLAGASVDDVFVVVVFTALTSLAATGEASLASFIEIPISIVLGIVLGVAVGMVLAVFFKKYSLRDTFKVLIILSVSFLCLDLEEKLKGVVPISGLIAIMAIGVVVNQKRAPLASRLSIKYNKLWIAAEVLLFVLVGAAVDIHHAMEAGISTVIVILGALLIRMIGVYLSLIKTGLTVKEQVYCMVASIPKATVQAAIGGVPLAMGLASGQAVLTTSVMSILIAATLGAILMDTTYKNLLTKKA